jgi:hypothetical protein
VVIIASKICLIDSIGGINFILREVLNLYNFYSNYFENFPLCSSMVKVVRVMVRVLIW